MEEEKMRRYLIIHESGGVTHEAVPFKKKWDLDKLQKSVQGETPKGYIESVKLKIQGKKYQGWAHEEALRYRMKPNLKASKYYHAYHYGEEKIAEGTLGICGPVVVENFKGDNLTV
tara:strand:- start:2424 stop:2771 length:348 start_codon:yes stop_codon:yes gene_type:complete